VRRMSNKLMVRQALLNTFTDEKVRPLVPEKIGDPDSQPDKTLWSYIDRI